MCETDSDGRSHDEHVFAAERMCLGGGNDSHNNTSNGSAGNDISDVQLVWWTMLELAMNWSATVTYFALKVCSWIFYLIVQIAGAAMIAFAVFFCVGSVKPQHPADAGMMEMKRTRWMPICWRVLKIDSDDTRRAQWTR